MYTGTSHIQPQSLPPTSAAASYHSMRVYHQFIQWKGKEKQVTAEEWGWRFNDDGKLVPIMTQLQPALEAFLRVVRCNCLSDCSSMRCTCKNMISSVQLHVDTVEALVALMMQHSISTKI